MLEALELAELSLEAAVELVEALAAAVALPRAKLVLALELGLAASP